MLLSKTCIYGLRASVLLATRNEQEFVTIRELSDELEISFYFLTKVLQQMTKANILESYKGPNGGVKLARPGDQISMIDVVIAIDGELTFKGCVMGHGECDMMNPCPLHKKWQELQTRINDIMNNTTIQAMADEMKGKPVKTLLEN